jgi:hypothetical protein
MVRSNFDSRKVVGESWNPNVAAMSSEGETANEDRMKRRRRSDASKVIDGTESSQQFELEHIEQRRGACTDIQRCCDLTVAWRARGKEAVRADALEEFSRALLGERASVLKVAKAVWEICTGVCLKNPHGSEERYKVALPDLAEEVMHTRRAIREAAAEELIVRDMLSTATAKEFMDKIGSFVSSVGDVPAASGPLTVQRACLSRR